MTSKLGALAVTSMFAIATASWTTCARTAELTRDRHPSLDLGTIPRVSLLDRIPRPSSASWGIEAVGTSTQAQEDSADAHWWDGFAFEREGLQYEAYALTVYDRELIAGGFFYYAGNTEVNQIARWDGRAWHTLAGGVGWVYCGPLYPPSCWTFVYAVTVWNGNLVAGGKFLYAGGKRVNYIARWDGNEWFPLGAGTDGPVRTLTVYNGDLVASGPFALAGEVQVNNIARWDSTRWNAMGSGLNSHAGRFAEYQGDLIASGLFTRAGDQPVGHIARWDGISWHSLGTRSVYENSALLVSGGTLIALVNRESGYSSRLSRWDGSAWTQMTNRHIGIPYSMIEYKGRLIAGGELEAYSGLPNIARWDEVEDTWTPLGSGLGGPVYDMEVCNGSLYVVGFFMQAGGRPSYNIARWDDVITPVMLEDFAASSAPDGVHLDWRLPADSGSDLQSVSVERAEAAEGPYVELEPSVLAPEPVMTFLDSDVLPGHRYWYRLLFALQDGGEETSRSLEVFVPEATGRAAYLYAPVESSNGLPIELKFKLVGASASVRLAIYDVRGRIVRTWSHGTVEPGEHSLVWDRRSDSGARVSRGLYFVRLQVPGMTEDTKRLVLLHR